MCHIFLMAFCAVIVTGIVCEVIGGVIGWLMPRLTRVLPVLFGGSMFAVMLYGVVLIALRA